MLADDIDPDSFSKQELKDLLGDIDTGISAISHVTLTTHTLHPVAICSNSRGLLVVDNSTCGVWEVQVKKLSRGVKGIERLICNLPQDSTAMAIASRNTKVYVTSQYGIHIYDSLNNLCNVVVSRDDNVSPHGVCANESTVIVTESNGRVFRLEGDELVRVSGEHQDPSMPVKGVDGFSRNATHAQPGPVCMEGNTVFVCDLASLSIRIISSIAPLLKFHDMISDV